MKNLLKFGVLALAASLWSCSDDAPNVDAPGLDNGDGVYTRLTLNLPTASRSTTNESWDKNHSSNSSSGCEIGKKDENNISSVLVILAQPDETTGYNFVAAAQADPEGVMVGGKYNTSYIVRFRDPNGKLVEIGKEDEATKRNVAIFAFCNPSDSLVNTFVYGSTDPTPDFLNRTLGQVIANPTLYSESTIWKSGSFLMTNHDIATKELPVLDVMNASTKDNPIDLGTVEVSRVAARFDYEPTEVAGETELNKFPIKKVGSTREILGYVTITDMTLFNLAGTMYYLPRVSATNDWANPTICGLELGGTKANWVVSTGYDFKSTFGTKDVNPADYFMYPLANADGTTVAPESFKYTSVEDILKAEEDTDEGWSGNNTKYHIWRYATENTIPGIEAQKHGVTTGVIFKGNITGGAEDSDLSKLIAAGNPVYYFNSTFYSLEGLVEAYNNAPNSNLGRYFKQMAELTEGLINFDEEGVASIAENADIKAGFQQTVKDGITIYRPDEEGNYPVYYYYYNRHNDNVATDPNNIEMGPMEFAVVRNNVYKLKINKISEFGHPGKPGDDPDPEDPKDPDEEPKVYFKVDVRVLPWVVRINNIEL